MDIAEPAKFNIPPFYTMEMMKLATEYKNSNHKVYHLEVGQPIVPTPEVVREEAIRMLREQSFSYCNALGVMNLREAIAKHYFDFYGLNVDPSCIIITPGSSLALYIALLTNFKKNAKIAIAATSYPCYRNVIQSLGYRLIEIKTTREDEYLITPESLSHYIDDIDGILLASPNNPNGSMYCSKSLELLSNYCKSKSIQIICDEIYHGLTYEYHAESILQFNSNATVINGFSKYFAMAGWRVGWMIVPHKNLRQYESLLQNMILCSSVLTQMAAAKAFQAYDELDQHVKMYQSNLNILKNSLYAAGITNFFEPKGAFYLYLELDHFPINSMDLCKRILYEKGVAVAPGSDFTSNSDKCSIRISFCQSTNIIKEASKRLSEFFIETTTNMNEMIINHNNIYSGTKIWL